VADQILRQRDELEREAFAANLSWWRGPWPV